MAEPELIAELERLLRRQDEYVDDTFEVLSAEYERAVRDVVDEVRGIVDRIDADEAGKLDADSRRVAEARLAALRSKGGAAFAVWEKWAGRLDRVAELNDEYFETAAGAKQQPSPAEQALIDELKGLWPDGDDPGSGTAGRFHQLSVHHRQELANSVTRHVLGRGRKRELVKELAERTERSTKQAEQLFRDATIQHSRSVQAHRAEEQGYEYFKYFGPDDRITRPFCDPLVGRVFSREEIDEMDNGQTGSGSVMLAGGGYNCRHHWQPVKREWFDDETWSDAREERAGGSTDGTGADPAAVYDEWEETDDMVVQEEPNSCGAACVRQLLRDQGVEVAEELLREHSLPSGATTARHLKQALVDRGFDPDRILAGAVRELPTLEQFESFAELVGTPFLSLQGGHWVIVDGVTDDEVVELRDPWGLNGPGSESGIRARIPVRKFYRAFVNGGGNYVRIKD